MEEDTGYTLEELKQVRVVEFSIGGILISFMLVLGIVPAWLSPHVSWICVIVAGCILLVLVGVNLFSHHCFHWQWYKYFIQSLLWAWCTGTFILIFLQILRNNLPEDPLAVIYLVLIGLFPAVFSIFILYSRRMRLKAFALGMTSAFNL